MPIPESSADTTPSLIQEGQKKVLAALFGIDGQSVVVHSGHHNYATAVYNVDLSGVVGYALAEESSGALYSVASEAFAATPNDFFVDVLRAEASSDYVFTVPVSDLDDADPVSARLDELLGLGDGYVFRDGMHSPFSRGLLETIDEFGVSVFDAIEDRLGDDGWPPMEAGEALRWIGDIDAPQTLLRRVDLLALALEHESHVVREGAVLGLLYTESEEGIGVLEKALQVETHPLVRLSIEETLSDLGGLES